MNARSAWSWHVLHVLLALAAPLLLSLMLGCLRAKASKADMGPEIPADQINQALAKAASGGDLHKLRVGQYLDFVSTRHYALADYDTVLGSRRVEVVQTEDAGASTKFTTRITNATRQSDNSVQTVVSQNVVYVNKNSAVNLTAAATTAAPTPRTTFHHLQESDANWSLPSAVAQRPGCGNLNPCALPVHNVKFDMILWQDASTYQKVSFDLNFAKNTPFIPFGSGFDQWTGLIVEDCRATQAGDVYIRDCTTLDDFQN